MLKIESLSKKFAARGIKALAEGDNSGDSSESDVLAVRDVSFEVSEGELFTLLGPSGCGKTTTLRCIAGLERPDLGRISLDDVLLCDGKAGLFVPANRRGIGMVFQSYAIWPHMSVYQNIAFPLTEGPRSRRLSKTDAKARVLEVLEVVELEGYENRRATELSGGQQQRLALARALAVSPKLMLLDEPLSNLDAKLRENMRLELKRLQRELGITSVYVTHDQTEALMMSSRIAVMDKGRVRQIGRPREIYSSPADRFVAEFVGTTNVLSGQVLSVNSQHCEVETPIGRLVAPKGDQRQSHSVTVSVRPEALEIVLIEESEHITSRNAFQGVVASRAYRGDSAEHVVVVRDVELRVVSNPRRTLPPGTVVVLTVAPEEISLVPDDEAGAAP